jgi:cell division protein FtsQ
MSKGKKILHVLGYLALSGILGAYFYFAGSLVREKSQDRCQEVVVVVKDSLENPLIQAGEVAAFLEKNPLEMLGQNFSEIDMHMLEKEVESFASVRQCHAVRTINGTLRLEIQQHMPLYRLETLGGSFFVSREMFIIPMVNPYRLPVLVVSGDVPFDYPTAYRGTVETSDTWLQDMSRLMAYLTDHRFWKEKVQRVSVAGPRDITIIPREEHPVLKIGALEQFEYKMNKLLEFYRVLVPRDGTEKYSAVDARFGNQLVCTRKEI